MRYGRGRFRGFTLAEIAVATLVFFIIIGVAYYFLNSYIRTMRRTECDDMLKREAGKLLETVMKDISSIIDFKQEADGSYRLLVRLRDESMEEVHYALEEQDNGTMTVFREFKGDSKKVAENIHEFDIVYEEASFKIDVNVTAIGIPVGSRKVRTCELTRAGYLREKLLASRQRFWVSHNRTDAWEASGGITLGQDLEEMADQLQANIEGIIAEGEAAYREAVNGLQDAINQMKNTSIPGLNRGLEEMYRNISWSPSDLVSGGMRSVAERLGQKAADATGIGQLNGIINEARSHNSSKLNDVINAIEGKIKSLEAVEELEQQIGRLRRAGQEQGWN